MKWLLALLLVAPAAFAGPSSSLSGRVTMDGNALPGVRVTITSVTRGASKTVVTGPNGDYAFEPIPSDEYVVRFELENLQTVSRRTRVDESARADAAMCISELAKAIVV